MSDFGLYMSLNTLTTALDVFVVSAWLLVFLRLSASLSLYELDSKCSMTLNGFWRIWRRHLQIYPFLPYKAFAFSTRRNRSIGADPLHIYNAQLRYTAHMVLPISRLQLQMMDATVRNFFMGMLLPFLAPQQPFESAGMMVDARQAIFIFTTNTGHKSIPERVSKGVMRFKGIESVVPFSGQQRAVLHRNVSPQRVVGGDNHLSFVFL